jgi:hypothetical protein
MTVQPLGEHGSDSLACPTIAEGVSRASHRLVACGITPDSFKLPDEVQRINTDQTTCADFDQFRALGNPSCHKQRHFQRAGLLLKDAGVGDHQPCP